MKLHETLPVPDAASNRTLADRSAQKAIADFNQYAYYQYTLSRMEGLVTDNNDKPGHLARRFQQISVAVFHAAVEEAGYDLTPVQYAALTEIATQPGIDQATLAGLIAYDRTTITGVVDRLVQKGLLVRQASKDRRAHALEITDEGRQTLDGIEPAVEAAQRIILGGLSTAEAATLMRLLRKAIAAGNELSRAPQMAMTDAGKKK
jgi:MarR family transcriptional regulator, temperature-dependent positive regulator of motility